MSDEFQAWYQASGVVWLSIMDGETTFALCDATGLYSDVLQCMAESDDGHSWQCEINRHDAVAHCVGE